MSSPSLIYLLGTSRVDGNTRRLLEHVNRNHQAQIIDLAQLDISYFDYEHRNVEDDLIPTIERLLSYQLIGFATPVYWYSVSAQLKTFIDRLSDLLIVRKDLGRALAGRQTFLLTTGSTDLTLPQGVEDTIKLTAGYMDMQFEGSFYARVVRDLEFDEATLTAARSFVDGLVAGSPALRGPSKV